MKYGEFKEKIMEELREIYGSRDRVKIIRMPEINGSYDGIQAAAGTDGARRGSSWVIRLDESYREYRDGILDIEECAYGIYKELSSPMDPENMELTMKSNTDWDFARENIHPVLLSTAKNRELLEGLVSMPMLDLSAAYMIRMKMAGGYLGEWMVSSRMLKCYGVSSEELHRQAIENMGKDGYQFRDISVMARNNMHSGIPVETYDKICGPGKPMYMLTNRGRMYGAAGILDKKMVRGYAGGRDFIILPTTIHETFFVPVTDEIDQGYCDRMISKVDRKMVGRKERLTGHSYYYDAGADEIRMCA